MEFPDTAPVDVRFAFVGNSDIWTYLGSRPVRTNPGASFATGPGLFGLHDLRTATTFTALREMLRPDGDPRGRNVLRRDTVPQLRVRTTDPQALQLDGDHVGRHCDVEFQAVSDALRVVV